MGQERGGAVAVGRPTAKGTPLNFGDGAAFRLKSGRELARALLVLRLCAFPRLVRHAGTILATSRKILGSRLWGGLLRATFYGQFVGGETPAEVTAAAGRLRAVGLRPMLAVPTEEDVGQEKDGEEWYEANRGAALDCVGLAAATGPHPMMQLKVTALMSARLCETVSRRLAEPEPELTLERVTAVMGGEDAAFPCLTPEENRHLGVSLRRLDDVAGVRRGGAWPRCPGRGPHPPIGAVGNGGRDVFFLAQHAATRGVRVLVDAEQSYVNPALSLATLALMARHNRASPWVWNTYQAYLQDGKRRLAGDAEAARRRGVCFGVKLVRGAYLELERRRAREGGIPEPVHPDLDATHRSYGECLELALGLAARDGEGVGVMVATHNEVSVLHATQRMEELGIPRQGGGVCFGQLLGMCDHVSLALGEAGYIVYKSVPYGGAEATLPYLARRAQENQGVLQAARRERRLLARELRRRLLRRP
ncbi:hydroxyproline dehydrogenase [Accipiter gentilis]|uniref:hydroxyproline dehydrogenase n=1 Tax=Astur gentilis TaxID=8957 RepID=UPI00211011C8|nr:hydroxyproline dehydrogenase [Accipiter gentilis]